jgi:signal peptidase II
MGASAGERRPRIAFVSAAALTLTLDQATKALATALLGHAVSRPLFGTPIALTLRHNAGSAFGLPAPPWLLIAGGGVVCAAILWYAMTARGRTCPPWLGAALGLVFGGAAGNLADRIRSGVVTDFIDLRIWPVFNVADIAITVGLALLAIRLLKGNG